MVMDHGTRVHRLSQASVEDSGENKAPFNADDTDNYDLPRYQTEICGDTVIDLLSKDESKGSIIDMLANAMIEQEKFVKYRKSHAQKMNRMDIAPTAEGKFVYWETAQFLEEKCFPHLFPTGTGGYLSTYQHRGVGFANYVKQRIETFCTARFQATISFSRTDCVIVCDVSDTAGFPNAYAAACAVRKRFYDLNFLLFCVIFRRNLALNDQFRSSNSCR